MKRYLSLLMVALFVLPMLFSLFVYNAEAAMSINKYEYIEDDLLFVSDFEIFDDGEEPTSIKNSNATAAVYGEWINSPSGTGGCVVESDTGNKYYRFYNNTQSNVTAQFSNNFNMATAGINAFKIEFDMRTMGVAFQTRWRDNHATNSYFINLARNSRKIFNKNIQLSQWNHVEIYVDDNKNRMQMWVNGILIGEDTFQEPYASGKTLCTFYITATLYPLDEAFLDNVVIRKLTPKYDVREIADKAIEEVNYVPSENGMPEIGGEVEIGEVAFNQTSTRTTGGLTKLGHRTYVSMNANPSYICEYDSLTGKFINSFDVNEKSFYYSFQIGADGNLHHTNGKQWWIYNPITQKNELHDEYMQGATIPWGMNLGDSGNNTSLYIAYSATNLFNKEGGHPIVEYNTITGVPTIYHNVSDGMHYMHGATGNDKYVFGSAGDDAGTERLIRIDKQTGERLEWRNDSDITAGNTPQCVLIGDKLFTRIRQWSFCIDINTMKEFARFESGTRGGRQSVSYPKPDGDPDIVYYLTPNQVGLNEFNLKTGEIKTNVEKFDYSMPDLGKINFGTWIQKKDGTWAIYACVADTHVALITPGDPHIEYIPLLTETQGWGAAVEPNYYHVSRDDILYIGGYRGGINGYDLKEGKQLFSIIQNSQHGIAEANGMIFGGTYSSGNFYMLDPEKPVASKSDNPKFYYESKYGCRHYTVSQTNAGFCMHVGIADYGGTQGSIIMSTYANGKPMAKEYSNIFPGENTGGMCYKDGYIYSCSNVNVNLHEPHEAAHIVKLDARTGEVILSKSYELPAIGKLKLLGEMVVAPNGYIYVMANEGITLLVIDPETLELVKYKTYFKQRQINHSYLSYYMLMGADGVLYTNMGNQLHSINIETLEAKLIWGNVAMLGMDNDGNLLKKKGANSSGLTLVKLPVDQRQRLDIMIRNAEKYYKEENYSKTSWKIFHNALLNAKKIDLYKDPSDKVHDAARKLTFAIQDLMTKYDEDAGFAYIYGDNMSSFDDMTDYDPEILKAVNTLKHSKIISGISNKIFAPEKNITRAEFIKLLTIIEGEDDFEGEVHEFADVPKGSWYYKYIQSAYERGWIAGVTDSEFAPDNAITNEQMIIILNRLNPDFTDNRTNKPATRAEAAKLLYDYINF